MITVNFTTTRTLIYTAKAIRRHFPWWRRRRQRRRTGARRVCRMRRILKPFRIKYSRSLQTELRHYVVLHCTRFYSINSITFGLFAFPSDASTCATTRTVITDKKNNDNSKATEDCFVKSYVSHRVFILSCIGIVNRFY